MSANPNFDSLATTTLNNYGKTLVDNVFKAHPLLDWLQRKDNISLVESPGAKIQVPLRTGANTTVKSYHTYDTLDITPQDGISAALYDWKSLAVSVAISGEEEDMNSGDAQMIDLFKAKVDQAQDSLADTLNTQLFSDGTGNSGKDFGGLKLVVSASGSLGGIDPATNTFWEAVSIDAATAGTTKLDVGEWTHAYYSASKGSDNPDFGVTTQDLFELYESGLVANLRYTSTDTADARFMNLNFKGIRLYFDAACETGKTYFLNSKYIGIKGMKNTWFRSTPFKWAADKDAHWSQILLRGNLVTSNRSRSAVIFGQTLV